MFKGDPELWSEFKSSCKARGVSVCHVLETLMRGWIEAQKVTSTIIQPVNMTINMQHVVKRPRRAQTFEEMIRETKRKVWPPQCMHADTFFKSTREVGCLKIKDVVKLEACWRCFYEGQNH